MNQKCNLGFVKRLCNETRPLHVLLHDQKLACFIPEVRKILNVSSVARLLEQSKTGDAGTVYGNIPVLSSEDTDNGFVSIGNHSSILYPSAFFLLILRSNKPAAVSFTRWLTREVLPKAVKQRKPVKFIIDDLKLIELIGKHQNKIAGQVLIDLEYIEAKAGKKPSRVDDNDNPIAGGE